MSIQARTLLRCSPRQVSMPHNLRFREQLVKPLQDITDSFRLLRRTSIAWFTMFIQTTLIADADRTTVVRSRMRPHFEQEAMLRHCPIPHKKLARALMPRQPYSVAVKSDEEERLHPLPFWKGRGLGSGLRTPSSQEGDRGVEKTKNFS